ncbi:phosphatase PAP2 family protein [Neobacillus sp. Marseille-QA0830]
MVFNYPRWSQLPYTGESSPPNNPEEPLAGSWPLIFLQRDGNGWYTGPLGDAIPMPIDPNKIDWASQLKETQQILANLTPEQQILADYWGSGQVTKQIGPIAGSLIDTYTIFMTKVPPISLSTPEAGRIQSLLFSAIADATIVCWDYKFRKDVARPDQQDHNLPTYLCTPRHPSYFSGHSVSTGVMVEVLGYFFPTHKDRLEELAYDCCISRLYAGVHFPIDIYEGLKLGHAIGCSLVAYFKTQVDAAGNPVDREFTEDRAAALPPGCYPYRQAIPYDFANECQSTTIKVPLIDRITKFFLRLFRCKCYKVNQNCNCKEDSS